MKPWHTIVMLALIGWSGCSSPSIRSQSPESTSADEPQTKLVGDWTAPYGTHTVKVEAVGLVSGLAGTGSDPPPSYERSVLLSEMAGRGVDRPNEILASPSTSLVLVRAYLRPGMQKGDHFDIEVRTPSRSETSSLRGGWLMETRLREIANVNSEVHTSSVWGLSTGPVLIDPLGESEGDRAAATRGRILSGAIATKSRPLGLVLKTEHQSVPKSKRLGDAINERFFAYFNGAKRGVATPKNDEYIELQVHPRYKDNVARYIQVIQSIALRETPTQRLDRISLLERQLLDPVTADTASIRLEAIGRDALPVLKKGMASENALVRFYSAEALAYLDDSTAAAELTSAARDEPAFRLFAFTALSAMEDFNAYDGLVSLLGVPSAETRYGAFRALWAMDSQDALVRGEMLNDQFSYHLIRVDGPPMIHLTRSFRPEVVMFGGGVRLKPPFRIDASPQIIVTSQADETVTISRFAVGKPDQRRTVSLDLDEIIRTMAELGGTYPDVVQLLHEAKRCGALACRLEVDALPEAGRTFIPPSDAADSSEDSSGYEVSRPLPELFPKWTPWGKDGKDKELKEHSTEDDLRASKEEDSDENSEDRRGPVRRAFGKIRG